MINAFDHTPLFRLLGKLEEVANAKGEVPVKKFTLSLRPAMKDGVAILGNSDSGIASTMTIFVANIAREFPKEERVPEFIRAVAHEFRHLDQSVSWDELPQVGAVATETSANWDLGTYTEDPGEADARDFSNKFLAEHVSEDDVQAIRQWLNAVFRNASGSEDIVVFGNA